MEERGRDIFWDLEGFFSWLEFFEFYFLGSGMLFFGFGEIFYCFIYLYIDFYSFFLYSYPWIVFRGSELLRVFLGGYGLNPKIKKNLFNLGSGSPCFFFF